MWFDLAAARRLANRDRLSHRMTNAQIAEAQAMARTLNYKQRY
jgi:hypothetical protein